MDRKGLNHKHRGKQKGEGRRRTAAQTSGAWFGETPPRCFLSDEDDLVLCNYQMTLQTKLLVCGGGAVGEKTRVVVVGGGTGAPATEDKVQAT